MHTIAFTADEIVALRGMIDIALKQLGGQAAKTYIILDTKLEQGLRAAPGPRTPPAMATAQPPAPSEPPLE